MVEDYASRSITQDVILRKQLLLEYAIVYNAFRRDFPQEATSNDEYWDWWNSQDKRTDSSRR